MDTFAQKLGQFFEMSKNVNFPDITLNMTTTKSYLWPFVGQVSDTYYQFVQLSKYTDGNNCPSSVIQIALVHNHDKAWNKCYTQDNTDTRETQVCQ